MAAIIPRFVIRPGLAVDRDGVAITLTGTSPATVAGQYGTAWNYPNGSTTARNVPGVGSPDDGVFTVLLRLQRRVTGAAVYFSHRGNDFHLRLSRDGLWQIFTGDVASAEAAVGPPLNQWITAALIGDGTTLTLTVNGATVLATPFIAPNTGLSATFVTGNANPSATGTSARSYIEGVVLYDETLTPAQIATVSAVAAPWDLANTTIPDDVPTYQAQILDLRAGYSRLPQVV